MAKIGEVYKVKHLTLMVLDTPKLFNSKKNVTLCLVYHNDLAANNSDLRLLGRKYPGYNGYTVMSSHKIELPEHMLGQKLFQLQDDDIKYVLSHIMEEKEFNPIRMSLRKILREELVETFYPTPLIEKICHI